MPAVAPQGDDRRIRRTHLALREALIALLPQRGWDDLSVLEICERANVGRSTFYMHYRSKEQLLTDGLEDLRLFLSAQGRPHATWGSTRGDVEGAQRPGGSPSFMPGSFPFVRGLLEHVHEQRDLFRSLIGRGSSYVVQLRFRKMVAKLVAEELSGRLAPDWRREALSAYVSGALVELVSWWVDTRPAPPLEDVETLFHELTNPVIAQAMRSASVLPRPPINRSVA